jgi:hypothetical protein
LVAQLRALPRIAWDGAPGAGPFTGAALLRPGRRASRTYPELIRDFRFTQRDIRRVISEGMTRLLSPEVELPVVAHDERVRRRTAITAGLAALSPDVLASFTDLERQMMVRCYGLDGHPRANRRGLARELDVDRKRIRTVLAWAAAPVFRAPSGHVLALRSRAAESHLQKRNEFGQT